MVRSSLVVCTLVGLLVVWAPRAGAAPVDLELVLAADVSGSIDAADFALQRAGFEAAFRSAAVISAIESGAIGSIAVTLWDFASSVAISVPWTLITDAVSSNAFADAIAAAPRGLAGSSDNQSGMIDQALTELNSNAFEGTRNVLDIASEGAQDVNGCSFNIVNCPTVQDSRDAFLAGGGSAINAIWLKDRDFFGLDPADIINAFAYGSLNVIGGTGSFQTFASDFTAFGPAIESKLIREIRPVPEPATLTLLGLGLALAVARKRTVRA